MRNLLIINIIGIVISGFIVACSELQDNITQPAEVKIHQAGVFDTASTNFHGSILKANNWKLNDCKKCHDANFSGGVTGIRCTDCHKAINVHVEGINDKNSDAFHGKYLGKFNLKLTQCAQCHGETYTGGKSSPSCTTCHSTISVHRVGIIDNTSPNFHAKYIKSLKWNLDGCKECHGVDYAGGLSSTTCGSSGCHIYPDGPEACNTCHGDFSNPERIAPPRDLSGNTLSSEKGVGAHSSHLYENSLSKNIVCGECHKVPAKFSDSGHIDSDLPAEVIFADSLAGYKTPSDKKPNYNSVNITCANTYCHGNFTFNRDDALPLRRSYYTTDKMEGNNKTVIWNKVDNTEAACGTCHDNPPKGHIGYGIISITDCGVTCHSGIVDNTGKIIDKTKHINGRANAFGD